MAQRSTFPPPTAAAVKGITALRRFAVSITVLNVVGHLFLGFEQAYLTPVVALLTAYTVNFTLESLDAWGQHRSPRFVGTPGDVVNFFLPAHITGLACAMLLYGNQRLFPTVFAVTVAIASKYAVRVRVRGRLRHMLNPSNLGISATLACFSWVAIAPPYEFTENGGWIVDIALPAFVLTLGTIINGKLTGRLPLIGGWIGGFTLQALVRATFLPDGLASPLLAMTGVAFILFTNYTITDPATSPSRPRDQVGFGLATALVYGALVSLHITFGLFYALTMVCAGRLLLTWLRERRSPRRGEPAAEAVPAAPGNGVPAASPVPLSRSYR